MYTVYVHYPCFEDYMDSEIVHTIQMPFVPRLGDDISIDREEYKHLEEKIEGNERLRKKYKRWIYGGGRCSFDDAFTSLPVNQAVLS